jgi:hypothetical protein
MIKNGRLSKTLFKKDLNIYDLININIGRKSTTLIKQFKLFVNHKSARGVSNLYSHPIHKNFSHKNTLLEEYQVIYNFITDFSKFQKN